ncbi:MAG: methyltransferase domain-containing protein [Acidobacteria bacterium]|nr:methyltransferase domain-containing protein [Acidobacteriota bacterium]
MSEKKQTMTEEKLDQTLWSWQASRIILTAAELNLFEHMEAPVSSAAVAKAIGGTPRFVDRLLNALAVLGLVKKENELFQNTALASAQLVPGKPGYRMGLGHTNHMWQNWSRLTEIIREGKPARALPNPPLIENWLDAFISAMQQHGSNRAAAVMDMLDLSGINSFLDVGGGSGAFSVELAKRFPAMDICIFDRPDVIPLTRRFVNKAGVSNIRYKEGDFLDFLPKENFDMVFMSHVIHSNAPEGVKTLFRHAFQSLAPGGQAVIHDFIVNDDRTGPREAVIFALNMLVHTEGGDTFSQSETQSWLEETGFSGIVYRDTGARTSLITAKKPEAAAKP